MPPFELELCSGDTPNFAPCKNPANWMLLPFDGAEEELRSPFCNSCAQVLQENFPDANPDGWRMTIRQAHLWVAQGRKCNCPHPGNNCEAPATVVLRCTSEPSKINLPDEILAVCPICVSCGNGWDEGLRDILSGFYLDPP